MPYCEMEGYITESIAVIPRETWAGSLFTYSTGACYNGFPMPLSELNRFPGSLDNCLKARGWVRRTIKAEPQVESSPGGFGKFIRKLESGGWSVWWEMSILSVQYDHITLGRRFMGETMRLSRGASNIQNIPKTGRSWRHEGS